MKKLGLLAVLSAPFFVAGFLWDFAKQGFFDGVIMHRALRVYFRGMK